MIEIIKKSDGTHAFYGPESSSKAQSLMANPQNYERIGDKRCPDPTTKTWNGTAWVDSAGMVAEQKKQQKIPAAITKAKEIIFRYQCERELKTLLIIGDTTITEVKYREWLQYVVAILSWDGVVNFPTEPA